MRHPRARALEGSARAADRLTDAASIVVVADRESDIHAAFARRPASIDLIVRAARDRILDDGSRLFAAPEAWTELARTAVRITPSRAGAGRIATVALRAGAVTIRRPRHQRFSMRATRIENRWFRIQQVDKAWPST